MALTDTSIRNAKPKERLYKLYDAKGLYIEVTPKGAKRWRFRYRHPDTGKERRISLGTYPEVSLKAARKQCQDARELLAQGVDPSTDRQMKKQEARQAAEGTFEAVAEEWRDRYLTTKSENHLERTWGIVRRSLLPYIGKRPIREIKAPEILRALRFTEDRGRIETAHRALQVSGQVFRYAVANGLAETDPTPALRGALTPTNVKHMAALLAAAQNRAQMANVGLLVWGGAQACGSDLP